MCDELKGLKNKVGQVCFGKKEFFYRKNVINEFWYQINNNNDILFVAPRRIGKTSIMRYIEENPNDGYSVIYDDVESMKDCNRFFKRLYYLFIKKLSINKKIIEKGCNFFKDIISSIDEISLIEGNLKLKEVNDNIDYFDKLIKLVSNIKLNKTIILLLDEIPYVLKRIWDKEGIDEAVEFLAKNRELRQKSGINNIRFVYAGSIGFKNIVKQLGTQELQHINNFYELKIPPLSNNEAKLFLKCLSIEAKLDFNENLINYLIENVGLNMPFYFQLVISKIVEIMRNEDKVLNKNIIDEGLKQVLKDRSRFSYWLERLNDVLNVDSESNYTKFVLDKLCKVNSLKYNELIKLNEGYGLSGEKVRFILNVLEHDGYIVENEDIYKYQSPYLKKWWCKYVTNED